MGFFGARAPPFLSYGRGFSSINLHQKETRKTFVKESKETRTRKGLIRGIFGLRSRRLGRALLTISNSSSSLFAPIWVLGVVKSNYERKEIKFYLFGVNGGSGVVVRMADLLFWRLVHFLAAHLLFLQSPLWGLGLRFPVKRSLNTHLH